MGHKRYQALGGWFSVQKDIGRSGGKNTRHFRLLLGMPYVGTTLLQTLVEPVLWHRLCILDPQ
jgi:hypothetical protein